jgi:hypothetical protein
MSQISPPLRILLIGSVLFLAAWMMFLRPKDSATTPAAPAVTATATPAPAASRPSSSGTTAHTSLGRDVQKARDAAQTAGPAGAAAAGEATPAAGSTATAKPATSAHHGAAPAKPAHHARVAAHGLPVSVAKALAARKVLVVYFWDPKALDDQAVRHELHHVHRHGGKVVVHVANVKDIARYAPIAKGVDVEQSPATVVVDRKLRGTLLTGYVDHVAIDQAVTDALHAK